jgi:ATP synthase protein I
MSEPRDFQRDEDARKARELSRQLGERIARAQTTQAAKSGDTAASAAKDNTAMARGLRLGTEFVAAIVVGAGAGYLLDQWFHTTPWITLVLLLVGFAAGVLNVSRAAAEMNRASPPPPGSDLGPGDDDEDKE